MLNTLTKVLKFCLDGLPGLKIKPPNTKVKTKILKTFKKTVI